MTRQQLYWRWCRLETVLDQLEGLLDQVDDPDMMEALAADWRACADQIERLARRIWPDNPDQWERRQVPQILQRS